MDYYFWASVSINILLCFALVSGVRRYRTDMRLATHWARKEREAAERATETAKNLNIDYFALADAVSSSLEAIRQDINRNYYHTHDGHVLESIAYRLKKRVEDRGAVGEIALYDDEIRDVKALGGETSSRRTMTLGQMLNFAWQLHEQARKRATHLIEVVSQPCGNHGHANWLGKMLAIYELMCDQNKDLAIQRLSRVLDAWRHMPAQQAPLYV